MERPPTEIAIAVVESKGRYLVGVRGAETVLAGYDEFPGGKVRSGETPAEAARRECQEESGLDVVVDERVLPPIDHRYEHGAVRLHFFRCRIRHDGEAQPRSPFRWISLAELDQARFPEANQPVLRALLKHSQVAPA